jgi:hypothetical protein
MRGAGGPRATILDGRGDVRVLILNHPAAIVEGFTITGGTGRGQGHPYGGGVLLKAGTLRQCLVTGSSGGSGGGVGVLGSGVIEGCAMTRNWTAGDGRGGGLWIHGIGQVVVRDCAIVGNKTDSSGAGVWAERDNGTTTILLERCWIYHNRSAGGGGAVDLDQTCTLRHCVIAENHLGARSDGGLITMNGATMVNCTIARNSCYFGPLFIGGGKVINSIVSGNTVFVDVAKGVTFRNSCAERKVEGEGNVVADPLFADPLNLDFTLRQESPCIRAGEEVVDARAGTSEKRRIDLGACP